MTLKDISLNHIVDPVWVVTAGIVAAIVTLVLYIFYKKPRRRSLLLNLTALRILLLALVIFCFLDPFHVDEEKSHTKKQVAILLDVSGSMYTLSVDDQLRIDPVKNVYAEIKKDLGTKTNITTFMFNSSSRISDKIPEKASQSATTDISKVMEELLAKNKITPFHCAYLVSDGHQHGDELPEVWSSKLGQKNIPVHTITVGEDTLRKDLVVEEIRNPHSVWFQSPITVVMHARAEGFEKELPVPVRIKRNGEVVAQENIFLGPKSQRVSFSFTPATPGFQVYEIELPEQTGEYNLSNNTMPFSVNVLTRNINVLYLEGTPHEEWRFVKKGLESDPRIKVKALIYDQSRRQDVDYFEVDEETGDKIYNVTHEQYGFPRTKEGVHSYDVIILSDIRREIFTKDQLKWIVSLVEEEGGGFAMVGGVTAFGAGQWDATVVDKILPIDVKEHRSFGEEVIVEVNEDEWTHPILKVADDMRLSKHAWKQIPAFSGYNYTDRAKPGATLLAYSKGEENIYGNYPIFACQSIGRGRSFAFTPDTTKGWGYDFERYWGEAIDKSLPLMIESNNDRRYFKKFWKNIVLWLAEGRMGRSINNMDLDLPQVSKVNDVLMMAANLTDVHKQAISNAEVKVKITDSAKKVSFQTLKFEPSSNKYMGSFRTSQPGIYKVELNAQLNDKKRHVVKRSHIVTCQSLNKEVEEIEPNAKLLQRISKLSGGQHLTLDEWIPHLKSQSQEKTEIAELSIISLWHKWWVMAIMLFIISLEWYLRRKNGFA